MVLWVNLSDLVDVGMASPMGSPLFLMIRADLGDELLPYTVYKPGGAVDRVYFVIQCTENRAQAIQGGIELIGRCRLGRKVRTRLTRGEPTKSWGRRPLPQQDSGGLV